MARFVPVIHGASADRPDEADTVAVAGEICASLKRQGFESEIIHLSLDLSGLDRLAARKPFAIFNLVEALCGDCALAAIVPPVLDALKLAYTGGKSGAHRATLSKLETKQRLRAAGVATADWWRQDKEVPALCRVIVKSATEHASLGIDEHSVVLGADAAAEIVAREAKFGGEFFAELYLDGREFNVAVLETPEGPRVLPIPEIIFTDWPEHRPRIVDYESKWDESAAIFLQSPRQFGLNDAEPHLAKQLEEMALACWKLFDLTGYARIDFRLDEAGEPHVLEINVNPCLAPDAGFAATAGEAGYTYDAMIAAIVAVAAGEERTTLPSDLSGSPASASAWRYEVEERDIARVRALVDATGFFTPVEVAIAAELVEERLSKGLASGYEFALIEDGAALLGYACYGLTPGTDASYDLYWIAVAPGLQKQGIGRQILSEVEMRVGLSRGKVIYAETSSTERYLPTRAFYEQTGFRQVAVLADFYRTGDGKVIYEKRIGEQASLVRAAE